jgi:hypothetical protein
VLSIGLWRTALLSAEGKKQLILHILRIIQSQSKPNI